MSLFGALFTGVSGLSAQATNIGIISDNIANVNTVGYKANDATFETLVIDAGSTKAFSPGGVISDNRQLVDKQGILTSTEVATDISLSGKGMFVVNDKTDGSGLPTYTRAGSFRTDENGNLQNSSGFYLQGWPLDRNGLLPGEPGNLNTTPSSNLASLETVNVDTATGEATATTSVSVGANLDSSTSVFPGEGKTITMDKFSASNFGINSTDVIVPDEFSLATTNSIERGDKFIVSTGNGLSYTYEYGGLAIGRDVANSGSGNVGDGGNVLAALTLAGGELNTNAASTTVNVTLAAAHGLQTGATVTLAGFVAAVDGIPASELNATHVITVTGTNTFDITVTTAAGAGGATNAGGETLNLRQFSGNVLDASSASQPLISQGSIGNFTTDAKSFTITTNTSGTVTFTYTTSSPSAAAGQFNTLNNLATAINDASGLNARVVSGRLIVSATDASEAVTFANVDSAGTAGPPALQGIDWVTELDLADVAVGASRFSTLDGLNTLVNNSSGVTGVLTNPLGDSTLEIRVDDPLDTIRFQDFVQTAITTLGNDPIDTQLGGGPGAVTVRITDTAHGLAVGQNIQLAGLAAVGGLTAAELNAVHTITTVVDANTYEVSITAAGVVAPATIGGGAAGTRATTNAGSLLAEFGIVTSLNGATYTPQDTGSIGPKYDAGGTVGKNMASGDITPQFSRTVRVFDSLGTGHDMRYAFIKIDTNKWAVEVFATTESEVSSTLTDGQVVVGTIEFNGDGTLRSVSSDLLNPVDIIWTNGALPGKVTFDWGTAGQPFGTANATTIGKADGFSQFDDDFSVNFVDQNGSGVGELVNITIDENGDVIAGFDNGVSKIIYRVPVADFGNFNGLRAITGNVYAESQNSGNVLLRETGENGVGTIVSGALEQSNADLAGELTEMIVAQRAYQSNTRVIRTTDTLLQELNDLVR